MFIEQAYKGKNDWWRVLITSLLVFGIFILNFIYYFFASKEDIDNANEMLKGLSNSVSLFLNLIPFAFLLGTLFFLVYFLHNRSILSLITSRKKIDYSRILFSLMIIVLLTITTFFISYYYDNSNIEIIFNPSKFIVLLLLSLLLFPFQIGLEEFGFRGYLMQQLGILFKYKWFPLIITSVLFGLFHSANPEVGELGFGIMFFYIGTGFLLGIMTLMDDSIELALGFHLGNNLIAALLITSDFSALQTDAIFKYAGNVNPSDTLTEMIISIMITYPLILFILAKKYKWNNWKEKLTGRITIISSNFNTENHD